MDGKWVAVFVFVLGTFLALLVGTFNFDEISLSPLETEYNVVMISGPNINRITSSENPMINVKSNEWSSTIPDALSLKIALDYNLNLGRGINLDKNTIYIKILEDESYNYEIYFTEYSEEFYSILKKIPKSLSITGEAIRGEEGEGNTFNNQIVVPYNREYCERAILEKGPRNYVEKDENYNLYDTYFPRLTGEEFSELMSSCPREVDKSSFFDRFEEGGFNLYSSNEGGAEVYLDVENRNPGGTKPIFSLSIGVKLSF